MTCRNRIFVTVLLAAAFPAAGAGREGITLSHFEPLQRIEIRSVAGTGQQKPGNLARIELGFDALGRNFKLLLVPNAKVLAAMDGRRGLDDAVPYLGRIEGVDGSWARVVIADGMPSGLISDGTSVYALEAPGDAIVDVTAPIIYRLADAEIAPGALSCATGSMPVDAEAALATVVSAMEPVVAEAAGAVSAISIGLVADFEATSALGSDIDTAIMTRLNNVDGIYSEQIGVQINVPLIDSYTDVNDPFSDTLLPEALLDDLALYRGNTPEQQSQGLTHLYTGRNLQGTTVGIAYLDVLCRARSGVGLSEISNSPAIDSLVAAHEIGHNFGAEHDGEAGTPCQDEPENYIMAPMVNVRNSTFSACSASIIQASAARASCVTALPGTDMSVAFRGTASVALLGAADNVIVDVVNNGTDPAQNVVVDVLLPTNVTLMSATSGAGSCMSGAGSVSCQLGSIAGGSATEIDLAIVASTVGVGTFDVAVTADVDDRAENNTDSLQLTVDPAVNLMINALPSAQVALDGSTTLTATFDNLATLDATNVTLGISLNAGLRADSASWTIGNCSVSPQQVDCQATRFGLQSSASLTLGLTGIAEGRKYYTVTLASAEADADTSDNTSQGSVRVSAAGGGSDEGGGSTGWLLLTVLGVLSLRRKP